MTLEEAENQFTLEHRTAITTVGRNEIVVKKRLQSGVEKLYVSYYAIEPKKPIAFNGHLLGEYSSLEEVKNAFVSVSFASNIDPNSWAISSEKG
jgi:hypothetical protein